MRLLTKIAMGMSVAALSVLVAGGVNADAATFKTDKTLTVTPGEMVSYDAVKDKKGELTWNAKAKWDIYYSAVDVDLANIKTSKDAYITVKGASTTTVYKIKADTVKKYAITIKPTLAIKKDNTEVKKTDTDWANFQYRTECGEWKALTAGMDFDTTAYEQQGSTLYFRYKGATAITAIPDATLKVTGAPTGTTVNTIAENSFPSKEVKVKVPKMANAPAISVDYNTATIKAGKNAEFRAGASFSDLKTGWADFKENYTISQTAAGQFQMRTKATDTKAASKIAIYSWPMAQAPTLTSNPTTYAEATAKGTLIANTVDATKPILTYEITDKEFKLVNGSADKTVVVYKVKASTSPLAPDGKAIATIKPGKDVKLTSKKVPEGTQLIVQYAGDKKTDVLPSPYTATAINVTYKPAASN